MLSVNVIIVFVTENWDLSMHIMYFYVYHTMNLLVLRAYHNEHETLRGQQPLDKCIFTYNFITFI